MQILTKNKRRILITITVLFLFFTAYLFLPIFPISYPPQEQFRANPETRMALSSIAALWGVHERDLQIFVMQTDTENSRSLAILDPKSFSSATAWIPGPGVEHRHTIAALGSPDSDIHLLNQYTPQSYLEKAIARNFYSKGRWHQSYPAVIVDIKLGFPFGEIVANSMTMGELRIPVFLTYALPISLHVDY